jgi:hypothetical protein
MATTRAGYRSPTAHRGRSSSGAASQLPAGEKASTVSAAIPSAAPTPHAR